jgi:hypothetical protein
VLCDAEDTVVVVPPRWRYRTDRFGFGWIEHEDRVSGNKRDHHG